MPKSRKDRSVPEISASSMADIAFLLLIFFLVVTTIESEEGVDFVLPPKRNPEEPIVPLNDRNVFKVILNSSNKILVEDDPLPVRKIKEDCKEFLSNNGANPELSDNPKAAVVSFRADRGTSYETYLTVLHELKAAYQELRAEALGIKVEQYLELNPKAPEDAKLLKLAQEAYPFQLSKAEPTSFGGS